DAKRVDEAELACYPIGLARSLPEWNIPLAFASPHLHEETNGVEGIAESWRYGTKVRITNVLLVLCLNVDTDPPDVQKPVPSAVQHCWYDPSGKNPNKAVEEISTLLVNQYKRWNSKIRYKTCNDPTVDEVKKQCLSLRRTARQDRILFHFNGHGVPRPTKNGETWVFNRNFTQYIPLSLYDLQSWLGSPSVYVIDCHNAGQVLKSYEAFCERRRQDWEQSEQYQQQKSSGGSSCAYSTGSEVSMENSILLCSCGVDEFLPMNPDLPADLFTACLTTPIKAALHWYWIRYSNRLSPDLTLAMLSNIPGKLSERKSMLGELNWIFTAVTDTIAYNSIPRDLFHRLFRYDTLLASLFRNFLLAERVLVSYGCTPVTHPLLPPMHKHPLWSAWDHVVDDFMRQLPDVHRWISNHEAQAQQQQQQQHHHHQYHHHHHQQHLHQSTMPDPESGPLLQVPYKTCSFFADHLASFEVWLKSAGSKTPADAWHLPIVLQVLLSQYYRPKALKLLCSYLDLGPDAVYQTLSVGTFPYILKLLNGGKDMKEELVFIWAKIVAVEHSTNLVLDLVKEDNIRYFINVLQDPAPLTTPKSLSIRGMAAFVLARLMNRSVEAKEICIRSNLICTILEHLDDPAVRLDQALPAVTYRLFLVFCLAKIWANYEPGRSHGARSSAYEALYSSSAAYGYEPLLDDRQPKVRAACVHALAAYMDNVNNSANASAQQQSSASSGSNSAEQQSLRASDLSGSNDQTIVLRLLQRSLSDCSALVRCELVCALAAFTRLFENEMIAVVIQQIEDTERWRRLKRPTTAQPFAGLLKSGNVYQQVWRSLCFLHRDPAPQVQSMAGTLVQSVYSRVSEKLRKDQRILEQYAKPGQQQQSQQQQQQQQTHAKLSNNGTFPRVSSAAVLSSSRPAEDSTSGSVPGSPKLQRHLGLQHHQHHHHLSSRSPPTPLTGAISTNRFATRILLGMMDNLDSRRRSPSPGATGGNRRSGLVGLVRRQSDSAGAANEATTSYSTADWSSRSAAAASVVSNEPLTTKLFEYCCAQFARPMASQAQADLSTESDPLSANFQSRELSCLLLHSLHRLAAQDAVALATAGSGGRSVQFALRSTRTVQSPAVSLHFHPLLAQLLLCDDSSVQVLDPDLCRLASFNAESGVNLLAFGGGSAGGSRRSSGGLTAGTSGSLGGHTRQHQGSLQHQHHSRQTSSPAHHSHSFGAHGGMVGGGSGGNFLVDIQLVNWHTEDSLLACAWSDGCVRLWRNYACPYNSSPQLISAFVGLPDRLRAMAWNQQQQAGLAFGGHARFLRLIDAHAERRCVDLPCESAACTHLAYSDESAGRGRLIAGFDDGIVKCFDPLAPANQCCVCSVQADAVPVGGVSNSGAAAMSSPAGDLVLGACLNPSNPDQLLTCTASGLVRLWDLRRAGQQFLESHQPPQQQQPPQQVTCFAAHPRCPVYAVGTADCTLSVRSFTGGFQLAAVRANEALLQQIARPFSVAFHPLKPMLALSTTDSCLSLYSAHSSVGL
ncbi:hypothetical protein BOX15_Mlig010836g3, partial [Macrostomum lignano]